LKTGTDRRTRSVGLFGGTFDPVHTGHLIIAEFLREKAGLDRIVFVPAALPPHKPAERMFDAGERCRMLQAAIAGNPKFALSDIELLRDGPSYSIDTVREMKATLPEGTRLVFIIGRDNLLDMDKWKDPQALVAESTLLIADRICNCPFEVPGWLAGRFELVRSPLIQISSTDIRRRIREGLSIRYLVPDVVREIVEEIRRGKG
jgi:nicotinate-nucleotide adenylyltransferase